MLWINSMITTCGKSKALERGYEIVKLLHKVAKISQNTRLPMGFMPLSALFVSQTLSIR